MNWFYQYLNKELFPKLRREDKDKKLHLLDIGGGRGDLSLTLAQNLPNIQILVIDINE